MSETPTQWVMRRMRELGLKQVDLANALGMNNPNKISKTFSGERQFKIPEMDILRGLLAETPAPPLPGTSATRRVPVIGSVAAGNWREAIQQPLGTIEIPADDPDDAVGLKVIGDSMNKIVGDGGTAIFSPSDRSLYPDRYYVVLNGDGETTFKQFKADPARLVPASTNPEHKEILIEDGGFQIVGRVIGYHGRL